jgi:2Fe-2S ferredoxin
MPTITFIHPDGAQQDVAAPAGKTVMQAALSNGIKGIVAECGGSAMCATCHVYVEDGFAARLPKMSADEDAMLDSTASERTGRSRLSCQLPVTPELDGMVVQLPPAQV